MRKILHVDMNSYFATMEQQAYPNLRGLPIGVAGKGRGERTVVTGASIEAKRYGVKSGMSTWEALRLCPGLIIVPACYDRYIFSSKRIFALLERLSPTIDVFSIDEAFADLGEDITWEEAAKLAQQFKALIKSHIGSWVTCSIGISYGKTLAKLASELKKPDGLTLVRPEDFAAIAEKTAIEELCGIGYRLRPRLNQMGIFTIKELGDMPKNMLLEAFGEFTGTWLHNIGNGIDNNLLRSFRSLPQEKSVGHSYTLPQDVHTLGEAKKVLLLLSERVGVRLRRKGLIARGVAVYLRFYDRSGWSKSALQKSFFNDGREIYQAAEQLLEIFNNSIKPVRLVAVTATNLVQQTEITQSLFTEDKEYEELIRAVDKVNNRYGEFTVFRSSLATIKRRIFNLPDGRNKRIYLPQITEVNPFTKRI
ncbi:MAG: DNA polymerase IV [Candidatus Berkelbacteria bacterium]|nr:MAG: DNA polymerase IV [Candidatus Berkelbacteria bacterium]QQG51397.1 MAG: DNA polymerase IV [Candidatus Berkelbacteria bacterium]